MPGYFYILASRRNGTLYCGVTNDLGRRVAEHKSGKIKGFTARYGVKMLVYFDYAEDISDAIYRESCVKGWKRKWKLDLIEQMNPEWRDFYANIIQL